MNGWLSYHNDNSRDGYDGSLPTINSPAVAWSIGVAGAVYSEPLFYNGNVYVATEGNEVYAINANTGSVEWSEFLGAPVNSLIPPIACPPNGPNIVPTIGITGTPAIDASSKTMYVAALINDSGYKMFALNTDTGEVRWSTPIAPSNFDSNVEEQRGALAIANGMVYVPFGGFDYICPNGVDPNGMVVGLSLDNNGTQYVYRVPASPEGDIWAPEGVSVDSSGFLYVVSGDSDTSLRTYGNAVLKLTPQLSNVSFFQASDQAYTNTNDIDLGSTGATLLPGNLVFSIGKDGIGYLLNASNLGGIGGQLYSATVCGSSGAWGASSYANGVIYVPCGVGAYPGLHALSLNQGTQPTFTALWNSTAFFSGPPIIAAGAVWTFDIFSSTLYALDPATGSPLYTLAPYIGPGQLPHFTTPSAGGGMLFFAENETVIGLDPAAT